jgi:hypothetical protein
VGITNYQSGLNGAIGIVRKVYSIFVGRNFDGRIRCEMQRAGGLRPGRLVEGELANSFSVQQRCLHNRCKDTEC